MTKFNEKIEGLRKKVMQATGGGNSNFIILKEDETISIHHGAVCYASLGIIFHGARPEYIIADVLNIANRYQGSKDYDIILERMRLTWNIPFVKKQFMNTSFESLCEGAVIRAQLKNKKYCLSRIVTPLTMLREIGEYMSGRNPTYEKLTEDGFTKKQANILAFIVRWHPAGRYEVCAPGGHSAAYAETLHLPHIIQWLKTGDLPFTPRYHINYCDKHTRRDLLLFQGQGFNVNATVGGWHQSDGVERIRIPTGTVGRGFDMYQTVDINIFKEALK